MTDFPVTEHDQNRPDEARQKAIDAARLLLESFELSSLLPAEAGAVETARRALESLIPKADTVSSSTHDGRMTLAFDVSDLLGYFPFNRSPTGIQRVQIELIKAFLATNSGEAMRLCRFIKESDRWVEVPLDSFMRLCEMSKTGADAQAKDWLDAYALLDVATRSQPPIEFAPGGVLVNLGSSWWLPNYFMQIRHLKSTMNVRYVPLIYDMIPAVAPQFCIPELVSEFITWLCGVLVHADYFLAISEATKKDLIQLAAQIGHEIAPDSVGVVPLDADFRSTTSAPQSAQTASPIGRKYVLMVSTLEVRKNQLAAMDAWRALINEYGVDNTPYLILVGKKGYLGQRVEDRLQQDEVLKMRVRIMSHVDDHQLANLYRHCLFTIYPSAYEGWGLPVTESLCYNKVPLIADGSSLPEAGGRFAVYFSAGSGSDFLAKLRKLIFDYTKRQKLEREIASEFRARTWTEIARQAEGLLSTWASNTTEHQWQPPVAHSGYYYEVGRTATRSIWKGMGSAENFRQGVTWWEIENWGCWSKLSGGGLQMRIDGDDAVRVALHLQGQPDTDTMLEVQAADGTVLTTAHMPRNERKWVFIDAVQPGDNVFRLIPIEIGDNVGDNRKYGIGLIGFFIVAADAESRAKFVEAAALGSLHDLSFFRRHFS